MSAPTKAKRRRPQRIVFRKPRTDLERAWCEHNEVPFYVIPRLSAWQKSTAAAFKKAAK